MLALCTMLPGALQAVTCLHQPVLMALHAYGGFTRCGTVHLLASDYHQFGMCASIGGFLKSEISSLCKLLAEGRSNDTIASASADG